MWRECRMPHPDSARPITTDLPRRSSQDLSDQMPSKRSYIFVCTQNTHCHPRPDLPYVSCLAMSLRTPVSSSQPATPTADSQILNRPSRVHHLREPWGRAS